MIALLRRAAPLSSGTAAVAFSDATLRLSALIAVPAALAELGAGLFGVWAAASSFAVSLGPLDLGLSAAMARFAADVRSVTSRGALLRLLAGAAAMYAAIALVVLLVVLSQLDAIVRVMDVAAGDEAGARTLLVGCALVFGLSSLCTLMRSLLQGRGMVASAFAVTGVSYVLLAALSLIASAAGWGAEGFVAALAAPFVLQAVAFAALAPRAVTSVPAGRTSPPWRAFIGFGLRMQWTVMADFAVFVAPRVLGAGLAGAVAVASLDVGTRAAQLTALAVLVTLPSLLRVATVLWSSGQHDVFRATIATSARRAVLLSCAAAGGLWATAGPALDLWLPIVPEDAVDAARILAVAFALNAVGGVFTTAAQARAQLADLVVLKGAMLVLAVVLLLLLGGQGALGLALAVAIALTLPMLWFIARELRRLGTAGPPIARTAAGALATTAAATALATVPAFDGTGDATELVLRGALFSGAALALGWAIGLRWPRPVEVVQPSA